MTPDVRQWPLDTLARGRLKRIAPGRARGIAVFRGQLWLTQLGDARDIFIGPGQTHHFEPRGEVLIEATEDSRFALFESEREGDEPEAPIGYEAAWNPSAATRHPALAVASGA